MNRAMIVLVIAVLTGAGAAQSTEATIGAKCAADWPNDFEMQAYCERQQRQAVAELQQMNATNGGIPEEAFKTALRGCVGDWPDDFEMQAYCLRQQIKGYDAVADGPSSASTQLTPEEERTIARHCSAEWPNDFEMQAYCEGRQADAAVFLRGHPDASAVRACAGDWPGNYEMQAYCVREGLY